jgi:ABC-type multidrug transport system ATPase subunit
VTSVGSAISVPGLVRGYGSGKNRVDVLQGLDMDVQSGSIYGLLGHQAVGRRPFSKFH